MSLWTKHILNSLDLSIPGEWKDRMNTHLNQVNHIKYISNIKGQAYIPRKCFIYILVSSSILREKYANKQGGIKWYFTETFDLEENANKLYPYNRLKLLKGQGYCLIKEDHFIRLPYPQVRLQRLIAFLSEVLSRPCLWLTGTDDSILLGGVTQWFWWGSHPLNTNVYIGPDCTQTVDSCRQLSESLYFLSQIQSFNSMFSGRRTGLGKATFRDS